jgi:hypothetical protein
VIKKIGIIAVCALLGLYSHSFASENNLIIKFGQMEKGSLGYSVASETTTIPLKLKDSGFRFGFTVKHAQNSSFDGYKIIYLPVAAKEIIGDLKKLTILNDGKIIKDSERKFDGFWSNPFWFDEGDPLGKWKIEIYLNGNLMKTIDFTVVSSD